MGIHITKYETKNGKTVKAENAAGKPADKNGSPGKAGESSKNTKETNQ